MNKTAVAAIVIASLALVLFSQQQHTQVDTFAEFKKSFGKTYLREGQEQYRKTIFLRNYLKIQEHNANPSSTWQMGVTQFADLTDAQFAAYYLTLQVPQKSTRKVNSKRIETQRLLTSSADVDWREKGGVSQVKDQGACGSCWAFAATGALESLSRIKKEDLTTFSEQDLVDCSRSYGNNGCGGGWMDSAYEYIIDHGIASEADYVYTASDNQCRQKVPRTEPMEDYVNVQGCEDLENALSDRPLAVAVDATTWSLYRGGVMSNCKTNINHGVLLVGSTEDFWIVKNSWSTAWGESGYIRLAKGDTCAICQYPSYPILSE